MKVTGYRFRRSAFVRGFMELAVMADGEAVVAVVSAMWPTLCLPLTPASPPPAATASASMSARSMRDIAVVSAAKPPPWRREGLREGARAAAASKKREGRASL